MHQQTKPNTIMCVTALLVVVVVGISTTTTYAFPINDGFHVPNGEIQQLEGTNLAFMPMSASAINIDDEQQLYRSRRQISTGSPPPPPPQQPSSSGLFGSLSDLGPQLEKAQSSLKVFSSMFNSGSSSSTPSSSAAAPTAATSPASALPSASQLMSQITSLVRSTQDKNAKALADVQQSAQQATQESTQAVQGASTGMAAALSEAVQGLQRIASSNPSLVPEVKNLYQSVSSKLTTTTDSLVPKSKEQQVTDQLTKAFSTSPSS